jgi:transglutaminase-like putative cysteine protease
MTVRATVPTNDFDDERTLAERILERLRPDEGWTSLALVLLLTGTMAWSISDARWILGSDQLTGFLVWTALVAALWGWLSARLRLSPWLAQALGCTIGAFVLIEAVGASLPGSRPGLSGWFGATADSVTQAYLDLTWRHQATTTQAGHFALLLGILVWATAQAASYDVFGYRRSINGVLVLGVVLVANMALTPNDQFVALVAFSGGALVLLLLSHATDERDGWLRHRIWRGRDFEAPRIEGGLAFASIAVAGALVLTLVASSAPLYSTFHDLFGQAQGALNGLSAHNPAPGTSNDFGPTAPISSLFKETTHPVFTVRVTASTAPTHWRMVAYETFGKTNWLVSGVERQDKVLSGDSLDAGTLDNVSAATPGRVSIAFTVNLQDTSIKHLIGANETHTVDADVQRTLIGDDPASLDVSGFTTDATSYNVGAFVPNEAADGSGLTEWRLQNAGTKYPSGLLGRYTQGVFLVGQPGQALLTEIRAWAIANGNSFKNEYDVAKAIQTYLFGPTFKYNTDITALMSRCSGLSTVDCFATIRQGFCEQYATTMTMLMRMDGFPARYVLGYLPGVMNKNTQIEQVTNQQKHAWVEVFFPTYGWIPFDPTGGGVGDPTVLVKGSAVTASPTPSVSAGPDSSNPAAPPTRRPDQGSSGSTGGGSAGAAIIIVPGILAILVLLALVILWRRRSKRLQDPLSVYQDVVKLASRLGYKPRPTQTVYEYTGMLSDVVPRARDSLGVVAMAAVEVNYGKRELSAERLQFLGTAHRMVRQALLGLALRMPKLGHRGGRKAKLPPTTKGSNRARR